MRYLLMIFSEEPSDPVSDEEMAGVMAAYTAFTEEVQSRGVYLGAEALQPTPTATTVRVRDGQTLTTDGPFAETKEALGGYYLIEARDLDEAIQVAAKCPGAWEGCVEVRPIWELPTAEEAAAAAAASAG